MVSDIHRQDHPPLVVGKLPAALLATEQAVALVNEFLVAVGSGAGSVHAVVLLAEDDCSLGSVVVSLVALTQVLILDL